MMEAKYIFIDVDGTLLTYKNELPESAVQAIHASQKKGNKVFPVTGRSKAEMYDDILAIGFDGYIGANGAYAEIAGKEIYHHSLSAEQEKRIVDWLKNRGLEFYLESNSGLYGSENFRERGKSTMISYGAYKGQKDLSDISVESVFPEMLFDQNLYRDDVNKISFILEDYQDYLDAKEEFADFAVNTWGGHNEEALFGDIALKNIKKSDAIAYILGFVGASSEDSYAFGDARVDNDMLLYCGTGIAMGNAGESTKAVADYITDDVDKDGLYKAFAHYDLI
ncbi:Cof-type HAD-IIB family hydrolase [Aerococcus tenax]|nr:Cof-type HAD-IIB family hydrolase [Aerococcus tenax]RAV92462.1 Cof-type HAD-IIB family hydrolase [Aerococcus tenax]